MYYSEAEDDTYSIRLHKKHKDTSYNLLNKDKKTIQYNVSFDKWAQEWWCFMT